MPVAIATATPSTTVVGRDTSGSFMKWRESGAGKASLDRSNCTTFPPSCLVPPGPSRFPLFPRVTFRMLQSESDSTTGSSIFKINAPSVGCAVEIEGVRFLFRGDANGKRIWKLFYRVPSARRDVLAVGAANQTALSADWRRLRVVLDGRAEGSPHRVASTASD